MMILHTSLFQRNFLEINGLSDFNNWVFYPGMLFLSEEKWWGDMGKRSSPHEGLDLCFYQDVHGNEKSLNEKTCVPVVYKGEIAKIVDDFIAKSVFVSHDIFENEYRLYTIYGHIKPAKEMHTGAIFEEADIIGTTAATAAKKTNIPPHLHLSLAMVSTSFDYEQLGWDTISHTQMVRFLDPILMFDNF